VGAVTETWRGIWVVAYRELLRFVSERSRMLSSFAMPLLFLVIFGAGFNRAIGVLAPGVHYIQFMFPGIVAMTVLMSSLFAGISVVWDREFGFLKEILVAPLARTGIVLGKAIGGTGVALVQALLLLVLAPFLGVKLSVGLVLTLIPVVVLLSLGLSGLGILIASFMQSQQGFQLLIQILIFPLIFLAGVFFPVNNVPLWMEVISKVNPLTYGVDAIRQVFLGSDLGLGVSVFGHTLSLATEMLMVAVLGAVLLGGAVVSFNRQE
jgi:ABC-2 type transport system permease protein